jgi:hypothetical protein
MWKMCDPKSSLLESTARGWWKWKTHGSLWCILGYLLPQRVLATARRNDIVHMSENSWMNDLLGPILSLLPTSCFRSSARGGDDRLSAQLCRSQLVYRTPANHDTRRCAQIWLLLGRTRHQKHRRRESRSRRCQHLLSAGGGPVCPLSFALSPGVCVTTAL